MIDQALVSAAAAAVSSSTAGSATSVHKAGLVACSGRVACGGKRLPYQYVVWPQQVGPTMRFELLTDVTGGGGLARAHRV